MNNHTHYQKLKKAIYTRIRKAVEIQTGKKISLENARFLFDLSLEEAFIAAATSGSFRLNSGLGVLGVHTNQPARRKLPDGTWTEYPARRKIRLTPGTLAKELCERGEVIPSFFTQRRTPMRDYLNIEVQVKKERKRITPTGDTRDKLDDLVGGGDIQIG